MLSPGSSPEPVRFLSQQVKPPPQVTLHGCQWHPEHAGNFTGLQIFLVAENNGDALIFGEARYHPLEGLPKKNVVVLHGFPRLRDGVKVHCTCGRRASEGVN